jgi:type I restriction enzyme S subunit
MVERSKCMNVPEIRFKEFDEVWSENLLEDFFTKVTSKNRKLKYSVVLTNSAEYGIIGQLDYFDFDVTNSNNIGGYFIVEPDDFVYNPRVSVSAPVGPINRNRLGYTGIMSPLYLVFKINGINKDFLCYYYKTKKWHRFMKLSGNCGARFDRLSISDDKFVKMPIIHPNNTKEQNQICKVFENLDDLIEESTLRLVSLNRIKAASLQSMFPQEGETVPKVRFKGFEEEWICVLFKEIAYKTGIKNSENLLLESYSISNELGFIPQNEQFENGGTMSKADKRMYYIVSPKSFAYNPARINVGSLGYYQGERDVIVSSLYEVFKTSNIVDDLFLLYWFKTNMFKRMIEQYQEGGVRLYFFFDKLQKCQIKVPSLQEQQKIASYFCNLDKQISLQTQHLEKLKQIKAACLDKMFV